MGSALFTSRMATRIQEIGVAIKNREILNTIETILHEKLIKFNFD